jgi:hypothetical protein
MQPKTFTLTAKQIAFFERSLLRWQQLIGVSDWEIRIICHPNKNHMAETIARCGDRIADIHLNKKWHLEPTASALERVAAHEVFHILVADLAYIAQMRYTTEEDALQAEEALVVRLENFVRNHFIPHPEPQLETFAEPIGKSDHSTAGLPSSF